MPLLTLLGRDALATPQARAQTATTPVPPPAPAAAGPIQKPLPPEWFDLFSTNAEMRWDAVPGLGYEIPAERFFVRNHTATPAIDAATWRLRLFGSGLHRRPGQPEVAEFSPRRPRAVCRRARAPPSSSAPATAAPSTPASRAHRRPARSGDWARSASRAGAGVRLAEVLLRAGLKRSAVDVLPQGLDANVISGGADLGHVRRPLPIAKSPRRRADRLRDERRAAAARPRLPARLIVPGWVGIASIKWLGQIEVADEPLFSPWNTTQYRMIGGDWPADSPPLTNQTIKAAFELPWNAQLPRRRRTLLQGRAWSGSGGADRGGRGQRRRRRPLAPCAARPPPQSGGGVGALEPAVAAAGGRPDDTAGAGARLARQRATGGRPLQHQRLPSSAPSSDTR